MVTSGQFDCGSNTYESSDEINWNVTHRLGGDGYQSSIKDFENYYLSHQYRVYHFDNGYENRLSQSNIIDCLTEDTLSAYLNHDTYFSRIGATLYGAGPQGVVKYHDSIWSEWSQFHEITEYPEMGCGMSGVWRVITNSNGVKYASTFGSTVEENIHFYHRVYKQTNEDITDWKLINGQPDTNRWILSLHFGKSQHNLYVGMRGNIYFVKNTDSIEPSWHLINYNLPNADSIIMINSIERESDRLWIATDRGVFYLNDGQSNWVNYTENLPNTEVTDIKVQHDRVYVGTYGRGVWFASAPDCFADVAVTEIVGSNDNIGPTETRTYLNSVKVPSDSTFIVEGTLFMGANCRIIVEPDANLIVNGGTITNACPDLWKGIEVWGTASQKQDTLFQGIVKLLHDAQIEFAAIAIDCGKSIGYDTAFIYDDAYNGGIVQAEDAYFYDNQTAVRMGVYPLEYQIKKFESISYFKRCNFTYTDDIYRFVPRLYELVKLSRIDGVRFEGCDWVKNTPEHEAYNRVTGLVATSAAIKVLPETSMGTPDSCSFTGLDLGIRSYDFYQKSVSTLIEHCKFEDNYVGIHLSATDFAQVTNNSFNVKAQYDPGIQNCGMIMAVCNGYKVEENEFYTTLSSPSRADSIAGLVIMDSGPEENQIYNNFFHDLPYATIAQGENRSSDGQSGLMIKCNNYSNNYQDISITPESSPWYDFGIKERQGEPSNDPEAPAGNHFSHAQNPNNSASDYNSEAYPLDYFHHRLRLPPVYNVRPNRSFNLTLFSNDYYLYYEDGENESCPSDTAVQNPGELREDILAQNVSADSVETMLLTLVDDGNTATLNLDVQASYPDEMMELRQELLDASPYLSDTVMISAAEKENVLPNSIITEVLVANPQSANSNKILDKLDERVEPPNNNQIAQIHTNDTVLGDKQIKEALIGGYRGTATKNVYDLVRWHMSDTTDYDKTDSILATLRYLNTPSSYYGSAFLYLTIDDSTNVVNTLSDVESDFDLTQKQEHELDYYEDYFTLLLTQRSNDKSYYDLDSTQMTILTNIVDNAEGKVKAYARNLHAAVTSSFGEGYIIFPGNTEKSEETMYEFVIEGETINNYFKLYPNPASEYITIEYNLDNTINKTLFEIITLNGSTRFSFTTPYRQGVKNIDLKDWKTGTYIISLSTGGKTLQSEKFTKF